jgi:hypothetical protein
LSFSVKTDLSLARLLLDSISDKRHIGLDEIVAHAAAQLAYAHALTFENTSQDIQGFWGTIIERLADNRDATVSRVESALKFISRQSSAFDEMVLNLQDYIPSSTDLCCYLYGMLGYDIGIVYQKQALINLVHPLFEGDLREIIFMSMHELHHVVYTSFNPFFKMSDIRTLVDLNDMIKYCTHLEGLGVYVPLEARRRAGVFAHPDYAILVNESKRNECVREFFRIFHHLLDDGNRQLRDADWDVVEKMTSGKRLWYITGAHMSEVIDKELGRETLNDTIRQGPDAFFRIYQDLS